MKGFASATGVMLNGRRPCQPQRQPMRGVCHFGGGLTPLFINALWRMCAITPRIMIDPQVWLAEARRRKMVPGRRTPKRLTPPMLRSAITFGYIPDIRFSLPNHRFRLGFASVSAVSR